MDERGLVGVAVVIACGEKVRRFVHPRVGVLDGALFGVLC
jgi:hypothetical protein